MTLPCGTGRMGAAVSLVLLLFCGLSLRPARGARGSVDIFEADQLVEAPDTIKGFGPRWQYEEFHQQTELSHHSGAWIQTTLRSHDETDIYRAQGGHVQETIIDAHGHRSQERLTGLQAMEVTGYREFMADLYMGPYQHTRSVAPRVWRRVAGQNCAPCVLVGTGVKPEFKDPRLGTPVSEELWLWYPLDRRLPRAVGPLRVELYTLDSENGTPKWQELLRETTRLVVRRGARDHEVSGLHRRRSKRKSVRM